MAKYRADIKFLLQLELPGPVLSKIAYKNALRLLKAEPFFEGM
jgi:hypothetical protein